MRQDYSWVPWFRALVANILANGRDWLVDRARAVDWKDDEPALLRHGAENIDPFSFLYFLASYAGELRTNLLLPVYESVHDKFDIGEEFPKACRDRNLIIPVPSTNFLFHDGGSASTESLWNLFRHAADANSEPVEAPAPKKRRGVLSRWAGKTAVATRSENPRKPETHGWRAYEWLLARGGRATYEEYRDAGNGWNHLQWDVDHGFTVLIDDRMDENFAKVLSITGVDVSKLTEMLFLIDPEQFLPVDKQIIDPMNRYLGANFPHLGAEFPQVGISIERDGYARYEEIIGRIRHAFPGCHPYEINTFLHHHGQQALIGSDPGVFQVSTDVFEDGKDLWSRPRNIEETGGRRTFNEDHCVYVGGPGADHKYPIDEPRRGDIMLVHFGRRQGKAIGIVQSNDYTVKDKDQDKFREDAAIHIFWVNKTVVDGLQGLPQIGFSRADGVATVFHNAKAYKVSFDLFDGLRDPVGNAPWANRADLTDAALAEEYPDVLGPGMWDPEATGGPPPGPREFWIAEQFELTRKKTGERLAMAMYARKGLGAMPDHYPAAWQRSGKVKRPARNVFLKFDPTSNRDEKDKKPLPKDFDVRRVEGYYRVFWLEDDAVDKKQAMDQPSEVESLQTDIDLQRPLNTILYGPPGTGKTYATRKRCVSICDGDDFSDEDGRDHYEELIEEGQVEFVTFHQSYGYEEFVEGLRPRAGYGTAGFGLVPEDGVLKRIAKRAREADGTPHVLVIDEINRANVSKVMGELVTLLEEDKREGEANEIGVTLPHSRDLFTLPPNLHILGTMNTADRSIALLDTALRRRFTFEELAPDPGKLSNVDGVDLPRVLRAINDRLEWFLDRDHLIGHAWFMSARDRESVDRIMRNKIIPLIAEYFYDDWTKVQAVLGGGGDFVQSRKLSPPPGIKDDTGDDRYRWTIRDTFDDDAYDRLISGTGAARPSDGE